MRVQGRQDLASEALYLIEEHDLDGYSLPPTQVTRKSNGMGSVLSD